MFLSSLAHKLAPSIIFIDEIDCFLRSRTGFEHDHVLRVKTEFMTLWDGLLTGEVDLHYSLVLFLSSCASVWLIQDFASGVSG